MEVKKFEAATLQEAIEAVKRDLGPEAIILQTKTNKKGFGLLSKASVEVTAAVSERTLAKKTFTEKKVPEPVKKQISKMSAYDQASFIDGYADQHLQKAVRSNSDRVELSSAKKITPTRYADIEPKALPKETVNERAQPKSQNQIPVPVYSSEPATQHSVQAGVEAQELKRELNSLRKIVNDLKNTRPETDGIPHEVKALSSELQQAFEKLIVQGIDRYLAWTLIKQVAFSLGDEEAYNREAVQDQIAHEMLQNIEVVEASAESREGPKVMAFVGPTGSGKTLVSAKMLYQMSRFKNFKTAIIQVNLGARSLEVENPYVKILQIPYRFVTSAEELTQAVSEFHKQDLILIDTPGISPRDTDKIKELERILFAVPNLRTHLVLAATTRDLELSEAAKRFSQLRPDSLTFTKLDEALVHGCIYNISQKFKLPLLYYSVGQKFPDEIEEATRERLVSLVLELI